MKVKLLLHNTEDLFVFMDYYKDEDLTLLTEQRWQLLTTSFKLNKPLSKIWSLAQLYLFHKPDIIMLCEVGGMESLENFARYFLKGEYAPMTMPSNSDRGIDLGYLIKKDFSFHLSLTTYKDMDLGDGHKFSRDVLQLNLKKDNFQWKILLTHLKSKLSKNDDFEGRNLRLKETKALIKIYEDLKKSSGCPVLIGGDFNGSLSDPDEKELLLLKNTDLIDVTENLADKTSYVYFKHSSRYQQQIDYLLVSPQVKTWIQQAQYCKFLDPMEMEMPFALTLKEKRSFPSDHYPLLATLNLPLPPL